MSIKANRVSLFGTIYNFNDYEAIEFLEFNRSVETLQAKNHQADLKESLLSSGTEAVFLTAIQLKRGKETYYKLIDGQNRFVICRDNNLTFNLTILKLEDESPEAIDAYLTRINTTSRKWSTSEFETKLTTSSLANESLVYMDKFSQENNIGSKIERNIIFLGKPQIIFKANMCFNVCEEQRKKAKLIADEFNIVKKEYISNKVMLTRNYLKVFHLIETKQYKAFTRKVIETAINRPFSNDETEFKQQLNKIGESFGFRLKIK
jgi:hypothetical protein